MCSRGTNRRLGISASICSRRSVSATSIRRCQITRKRGRWRGWAVCIAVSAGTDVARTTSTTRTHITEIASSHRAAGTSARGRTEMRARRRAVDRPAAIHGAVRPKRSRGERPISRWPTHEAAGSSVRVRFTTHPRRAPGRAAMKDARRARCYPVVEAASATTGEPAPSSAMEAAPAMNSGASMPVGTVRPTAILGEGRARGCERQCQRDREERPSAGTCSWAHTSTSRHCSPGSARESEHGRPNSCRS